MAERGDVQTQILFGVGSTAKPVITVPAVQDLEECCYITPVFGNPDYIASPDPLKEGTNSYFNFYDPNAITAVTLNIQKCVGGAFVTQHTIIDDTYGTFKDLGVEIKRGLNYISIKNINWSKVLVDFGAGTYRIYTNESTIYSGGDQHAQSLPYNLMAFTESAANFTVRFKIKNAGILGDAKNPRKTFEFPDDWEDELWIEGSFGDDFSELEEDYTVYNDGSEQYTKKKRIDKIMFVGDRTPQEVRTFFKNELMMADLLEVTNYANNRANEHLDTPVHGSGDFKPNYIKQSKLASFDVEFKSAFDLQEKLHC